MMTNTKRPARKSAGRKAMDAHRAALPAYAALDPRMLDFNAAHRCATCGCRAEQHAQGGQCPKTGTWATPVKFPSMDLDDAAFNAACEVYWMSAGTTFKAK